MANKKGPLRCIAKPLISLRSGARTRSLPDLGTLLRRHRWHHFLLGHSVDAGSDPLDLHLIAKIVCNGRTPFLELVRGEFELVVLMAEDTVGTSRRVGEARTGGEILTKIVIEAVVGGGDEDDARAVLAKDVGRKSLQSCLVEMLDDLGRNKGIVVIKRLVLCLDRAMKEANVERLPVWTVLGES